MIVSTTQTNPWMMVSAQKTAPTNYIEIQPGELRQTIRGFGGCFSELGARALQSLSPQERDRVNDALFSADGCGFTFCRLPIGASDFAHGWYSYDELPGDYQLKHFSIERDKTCIIPWVKQAQSRQSAMQFMASPWSPPTWMKEPPVYNYGKLIHTPENEAAYANYLRRYVAAYAEQGIHIDQLHLQNEPTSTQKFPSCVWTGEEMRDFIKRNFADGICPDTDLWLGTLNGPASDERYCWTRFNNYAHTVLQDEVCRKAVAGVGYQWGGKFAVQQTHDSYPELELIQTESECGNGENTWEYALYIYELMHHYFRNGASAYMYWNMVLPAGGESSWGWRQNSLVTVNEAQPQYNHEYYLMKHFAHFVKPGARYLQTHGAWSANTTAFQNSDGTKVFVILNPLPQEIPVAVGGASYTLQKNSLNTIVINQK